MANKLTNCSVCGAEMAANAKSCPQCGAKNKKPIYKKWWFWVLIIIVVFGIIGGTGGNKPESASKPVDTGSQKSTEVEIVNYAHYNVTELFDAVDKNAAKAQSDFKSQYVEIEGYLSTIDSDGKYISVGADPNDYDYLLRSVHCDIKSEEQLQIIMNMSSGDPIVVRGKITDVGEVLGYYLNIDSIG